MQYATITDWRELVNDSEAIEGTNVDNAGALLIDKTHLDRALIAASNKINGALSGIHAIPITPPPPDLIRICIRIARFEMEIHEVRDVVQTQYDAAIADLNAYRTGASTLIGADGKPVPLKRLSAGDGVGSTAIGSRRAGNVWNQPPPAIEQYPARGIDYRRYPGS